MPRVNVMFMQTQTFFGADSAQHAMIMRYLDRGRWRVHAACNAGEPGAVPASLAALERIPDMIVRPTRFGRGFRFETSRIRQLGQAVLQLPSLLRATVGLAGYVRREQIRIVHCTEKPRDALIGYAVATLGGAHPVIHVHIKAETWINRAVRAVMRRCDLIAITEFVRSSLVELGYPPERIHVVLNGMDTRRWEDQLGGVDERGWSADSAGDDVRAEFGIAPGTPLVVCVGRLNRWKGQLDLVRALGIVKQRGSPFAALVVGEPDDVGPDDPRYFDVDAAKALADELGVGPDVIFTGYRRDVPRLIAAGDVYAMPSFEEPFGMVYLEAMALGKPVASLDNGGTPEVVGDGATGLLSPPGDLDALAANLVTLLGDPELRRRFGEEGRRVLEADFNPERVARDVAGVYDRVLAR